MLEQLLFFTSCSSIQFFNSPASPDTVNEAAWGNLSLTVLGLYDLWDPMPLHWSPSTFHPNSCLGKQRISLACASAHKPNLFPTKRYYLVGSIYVLGTAKEYYINLSLVSNPLYY